MYEGVPTYPDAGRPWRIAEQLGVNIFHTAPTTIRMLRKLGPDEPAKYNYHFKHMTTVGEPIEPEVWRWYYEVVGKGEAAIIDTWWQTENGGFLGSTLPGAAADEAGQLRTRRARHLPRDLRRGRRRGPEAAAARRATSASATRGRASSRRSGASPSGSSKTYYAKYNRNQDSKDWRDWPYFAGDGAVQAADGYFRILGRVDDVINVAGHRLGTKELESACLTVEEVAEAAAVPVIDELRGRASRCTSRSSPASAEQGDRAEGHPRDRTEIGKIARPKNVWIVSDMPKTRSGKIMRRVIAAHLQLRRRRRRDDARQPRDRRGDPPPGAEREAGPRREPARALRRRRSRRSQRSATPSRRVRRAARLSSLGAGRLDQP